MIAYIEFRFDQLRQIIIIIIYCAIYRSYREAGGGHKINRYFVPCLKIT